MRGCGASIASGRLRSRARWCPGLLRGDWEYDGILVTDDFSMGAVYRSTEGWPAASVSALNAGVDLILISYDPDQYFP